jgi:hypothetical protein
MKNIRDIDPEDAISILASFCAAPCALPLSRRLGFGGDPKKFMEPASLFAYE